MSPVTSKRQAELESIAGDRHTVWLAGQIDEVEDGLLVALNANTSAVTENTKQQHATAQRITLAVLSLALTVLGGVIVSIVTGLLG